MGNFCKIVLSCLALLVSLIVGFGFFYYVEGEYAATDTIGLTTIDILEDTIHLKGYTSSSATGFSKYMYTSVNDALYIRLKYSLVSRVNPNADFSITIIEPTVDINQIYIQGKDHQDIRLIWEK
ncbi:MAG: hypothetical protein LPK26_14140 [Bacillaceae bacterium]|nr:hypothetical protein [Bacillaceae bacterium]